MGKLIRCITDNGAVMAVCADTTDIAAESERIHGTSAVITAQWADCLRLLRLWATPKRARRTA